MKPFVRAVFGACLTILALVAFTASAFAATIDDGGFESFGTSSWVVADSPDGTWDTYTGSTSPVSGSDVYPVLNGTYSVVSDQDGPSAAFLYQDITLEPGIPHPLSFDYFIINAAGEWDTPSNTYDVSIPAPLQRLTFDVIKPTAAIDTTDPADILTTIYDSESGDPVDVDWATATADLTAFGGQTVRLRFANANNQAPLWAGLDNVAIDGAAVPPPTPVLDPAIVKNGGFENNFTDWTRFKQLGSAGNWMTYTGELTPLSGSPAPLPKSGGKSAVTDQSFPSTAVLYQDVTLPTGFKNTLKYSYWYANQNDAWAIPDPLTYDWDIGPDNQQMVFDVIKPTAAPDSADPADVLAGGVRPLPGQPLSAGWTDNQVDLSPFNGQTVRLRYLVADNSDVLNAGLDDVSVLSVDNVNPTISMLRFSPKKFRTSGRKKGSTISYSLSEQAAVTGTILVASKGKRSGKSCKKPSRKLAKKKNCTRWVKLKGSLTQNGVAGANSLKFSGKLRGKALKPGNYRLELNAADPTGNKATTAAAQFKVVPAKKKRR